MNMKKQTITFRADPKKIKALQTASLRPLT